jgi:hypothetical protein
MSDMTTSQIAVGSPPQQQTNEGGGLPTLLQVSSVVATRSSVVNAVQQEASTVEEAQT